MLLECTNVVWFDLVLQAKGCGKMRRSEEGLSFLTEALAMMPVTEWWAWEPEVYRLKGELRLA